ncbi:MAG: adenosylcobinamide kinase/adenosylcobinamide-phosphate guanylyltransferase [Chthonomonadaceae bacterium]|nr:adenosylcobinamide kinase/adenosylcobinamide-phosphate guanylyltransferase [Chthonomonadaceae bacterium]
MSEQAKLVLVTGGARSGKSRFAQQRAEMAAREQGAKVLFIATAEESDDEMAARISRHRHDRPADWTTIETPLEAAAQIVAHSGEFSFILLDCLTLFVSNHLLAAGDIAPEEIEAAVDRAIAALLDAARSGPATVLIVTNEVGMGLHPMSALGRLFQDIAGRANQQVAAAADEVVFMVSGLPLVLKPPHAC